MRIAHAQSWPVSPRKAAALQRRLRDCVRQRLPVDLPANPLVAGADISYDQHSDRLFAAVVVLQLPSMEIIETVTVVDRARFPYVPGLLSFREGPALLKCFRKLKCRPDVVMIDGHGLAHPRRFGIACHVGWLLNLPTLGCAKSILVGERGRLRSRRGATTPLLHRGETVGIALRTRQNVQPVFVSVGHRIDLATAAGLVLRCARHYRLPEPTRQAHLLVNTLRTATSP